MGASSLKQRHLVSPRNLWDLKPVSKEGCAAGTFVCRPPPVLPTVMCNLFSFFRTWCFRLWQWRCHIECLGRWGRIEEGETF